MIVEWASSERLREVVINAETKLKEVDDRYLAIARESNVNLRRIKNNRSERRWVVKTAHDARAELVRRGEGHTIPYWAKKVG